MEIKESRLKIALAICIVTILVLAWVICVDPTSKDDRRPYVNDGVTALKEFDLDTETGSSAKGTVFVMQSEDSLRIKITADVIVGETNTDGAIFAFTPELRVTEVLSSYKGDTGREHIRLVVYDPNPSKPFETEYNSSVEIGCAVNQHPHQPDSGRGTVTIELQLSRYATLDEIDSLYFLIAIGGTESDPSDVIEKITIPLV